MATITTDDQLKQEIGKLAGGEPGVMPKVEAVLPTVKDDELQTTEGAKVIGDVKAPTAPVITPTLPAKPVGEKGIGEIDDIATNVPRVTKAKTAQITDPKGIISDVPQGVVSEEAIADPAQAELDKRATIKFQLADLFNSLEDGEDLPAWAAPAVRKVSSVMQARGLGASSMASAAITQAIM